ncbi:MAG: chemotaxis protein CheW [Drouetiella hepatica Uher 2000/2452]|jgi:purine-binding chemotaxis protein CheW|uniref:Chemotaxis protein CheW n=1 Tax=Drouetiella hepatica Uher 2000/2452 TaxID=904376 RepID=A0A951Q7S4_9CYAN|nr:chemotaxis protein CheW [Drouetiella hepatica Uher 2000/2452]
MPSSLSRRLANRRAEATQKLVVFSIHQTGFTLPIQAIEKVIPLGELYGAPNGQGLRFTHYKDQQILVIDAQQRIFGIQQQEVKLISSQPAVDSPSAQIVSPDNLDSPNNLDSHNNLDFRASAPAYLLIIQDSQGDFVGIPLYSQPSLRRVPLSAFKPLPSAYLAGGKIRCVSALVVIPEEPPLFLLNLDQLLKVETRSLPSTF